MRDIYCVAGKQTVSLPEEAWEGFKGVTVPPCNGCQHKYHLEQLIYIQNEIQAASEVNLHAVEKNTHNVGVVEKSGVPEWNNAVICTCNCNVVFPE